MGSDVFEIEWGEYVPFDHGGPHRPFGEMTRAEARRCYEVFMEQRLDRVEQLRRLLALNGVELSDSVEGILALEEFWVRHVEPRPDDPSELRPLWHAVGWDVFTFLAEVMIERFDGVHWHFFTGGRKNASYQRPVLMGFGGKWERVDKDLNVIVIGYGYRLIRLDPPDRVPEWIFPRQIHVAELMWRGEDLG